MDINQKINLGKSLFSGGQAQPSANSAPSRMTDGTAMADSAGGIVPVRFENGDVIDCRCISAVKEGDTVSVLVQGGSPMVLGRAGWGDDMEGRLGDIRGTYLHVRFSAHADGTDFTEAPADNTLYMGVCSNETAEAPTDKKEYVWVLVKGNDGVRGEDGDDGTSNFIHIKYSNDGGSTFTANGGETVGDWMGTCVTSEEADPTSVSAYTWKKVKGEVGPDGASAYEVAKGNGFEGSEAEWLASLVGADGKDGKDGSDGLQGPTGPSGLTSYLHIAYAASADGKTGFSVSDASGKTHIGTYTDFTKEDSTDPEAYKWALIKGEQGVRGEKGATGASLRKATRTSSTGYTYGTLISWVGKQNDFFTGVILEDGWQVGDQCLLAFKVTDKGGAIGYMRCEILNYNASNGRIDVNNLDFMMGPTGETGPQGAAGETGLAIVRGFNSRYAVGTSVTTELGDLNRTPKADETVSTICAGRYFTIFKVTAVTSTSFTIESIYEYDIKGATGEPGPQGDAGDDGKMLFGTCSTDAATAAKTAAIDGFSLYSGVTVAVKFAHANTAANPTLDVSGTGAKPIMLNGVQYTYWIAGATVSFVYDGANWQVCSTPVYGSTATIGNPSAGNVYIDSDSVDVRSGSTVLALFASKLVELGKNAADAVIRLCNGKGTISTETKTVRMGDADVEADYLNLKSDNAMMEGTASAVVTSKQGMRAAQVGTFADSEDGASAGIVALDMSDISDVRGGTVSVGGSGVSVTSTNRDVSIEAVNGGVSVSGDSIAMASDDRPTWNGSDVAMAGDLSSYLPKSGGIMTGNVVISKAGNPYVELLEPGTGKYFYVQAYDDNDGKGVRAAIGPTFSKSLQVDANGNVYMLGTNRPAWNGSSLALQSDVADAVGGSYLPLSGGEIEGTLTVTRGDNDTPLYIKAANLLKSYIGFIDANGTVMGYYGFNGEGAPRIFCNGVDNVALHSGNISDYAAAKDHSHAYLPLSGGTMTGETTIDTTSKGYEGYTGQPALSILHAGMRDANDLVDMAAFSVYATSPFGLKFKADGNGVSYIQSQRINSTSEMFPLSLNPYGGKVLINGVEAAKKSDIPEVPTNVSAFANDAGYLTAHQDLSAYATTSAMNTALNKKANDYTIEMYNGTSGNPKPVRFASFNYSTCNSENGIAAKIGMVSGHGNGTSYAFLQDAIIRVGFNGNVEVDNLKYYGASAGTYDGAARQYGDIFWLVDAANKIVDFYVLMGQYARLYQTPWKRLTYSSGGTVTQHTSCTVYSSGTKSWANNSSIAMLGDIPSLSGYATEAWVDSKNYLTAVPSGYVTETELAAKNYLTAVPSEYVTESELNAKGYLTSHQSLAGYATQSWVEGKGYAAASSLASYLPLAGGLMAGSLKFQSSSLPQKALEYITGIDAFANGGELGWQSKADFLAGYATTAQLAGYSPTSHTHSDYASKSVANTYNGEQKFQNSTYCPTVTDTASGVGCAFKASRGMVNELLADKLIMTASTGKIPFCAYAATGDGQMTDLAEVASITSDGAIYANGLQSEGVMVGKGGLLVSGRVLGSGDDEGIIIGRASNSYAGLCLGSPSGVRSVHYLMPDNSAVWRWNNGSAGYDIKHPGKAGTIALTSDIPSLSGYLPKSGGSIDGSLDVSGDFNAAGNFVLKPPTGEGGQILLEAAADDSANNGIAMDTANGDFRLFGLESRDGTSRPGFGSVFGIDPYDKTIYGGYSFDGTAAKAVADGNGNDIAGTYATKAEMNAATGVDMSAYLLKSGGTMSGPLVLTGGDAASGVGNMQLDTNGQITAKGTTATLFGRNSATSLILGHGSHSLAIRGSAARPTYNGSNMALQSDIPTPETGTSGIWEYVKHPDGRAECWGRYTTTISCDTAYNPGYYNGSPVVVNLPFTFASVPTVTGSANALAHFALDSGNRTTSAVGFYCWRPGSGPVSEVSITVKGRWK